MMEDDAVASKFITSALDVGTSPDSCHLPFSALTVIGHAVTALTAACSSLSEESQQQ